MDIYDCHDFITIDRSMYVSGINATGLPPDLESHYSVINSWEKIDAPQNHVIISIPSVLDPSLVPEGCHVIHAYAAANEVLRYSPMMPCVQSILICLSVCLMWCSLTSCGRSKEAEWSTKL